MRKNIFDNSFQQRYCFMINAIPQPLNTSLTSIFKISIMKKARSC